MSTIGSQHITISPATQNITIELAGPVGPSGLIPAGGSDGQVIGKLGVGTTWLTIGTSEEIDTKIATHEQAEVVHNNATSGRDFSALFQNGLI